ncbi:MAG: HAMP domain-containing histidine kinase [Lachnospiraceae bacterium]|nr:HAMP domain-containing histidine kinase [Lachnospiraceae bacterium]
MEKSGGKKRRRERHYSLKREMAAVYICLLGFTLAAVWVLNDTLLERSYLQYKRSNLIEVYEKLEKAWEEDEFGNEDFESEIMHLCNVYNVNFVVTDASSNTIYSNIKDPAQISRQLRDILFARDNTEKQLVEETDHYSLTYMPDPFSGTEYATMWGNLDDDCFFMIRTALESVRESVNMANRMLLYIGLPAIVLAGVVIWFVTKKITGPILSLVEVSKRMAEMDFDSRYEGTSKSEIGVLGENMNILADRLEENISQLKTANLELQKDVKARRNAEVRRQEFLANVSHELKTPIALIQGYAEGLKDGISDDQESRDYYCDVIMDETRKMNHLVKRLISLNHVESGEDIMQMERFDLNELLMQLISSFEQMCRQKGIRVCYDPVPGSWVWGDEYQVEEVLRNYFSNAVNYCDGKKEIRIKLEERDGRIRTSVFNSGKPIPQESLERLWDKFYKVDKARTREYGGSGLGLSIVKAIMESMKQAYGVTNYDDGVEFWFELETK